MTVCSWWLSFGGVAALSVALVFSSVGIASVWWTGEVDSGVYPILTEVSLWVSSTTSYEQRTERSHYGCTGPCDRTQNGRARVVTSCSSWDEVCADANFACGRPAGDGDGEPSEDPEESAGYSWGSGAGPSPATPPPSTDEDEDVINRAAPTRPPLMFLPETTITSTEKTTSTMTTTETSTTTSFTTHTTPTLTALPGTTRALLRPNECPMRSPEETVAADFTLWELNFDLEIKILSAIDRAIQKGLITIPAPLFQQRPTMPQQVRLVWEVLVERSDAPKWLWEYKLGWCPSVPAEQLHYWLTAPENRWTYEQMMQLLEPPDVKPEVWQDWALKDAWEKQSAGELTTPAPLFEGGSAAQAEWAARWATTTLPHVGTMQPKIGVPIQSSSQVQSQRAPVMSLSSCQKARSDGGLDLPTWHEEMEPCSVQAACGKIWIVRAGLLMHLALGLFHVLPSCLSFIGSNQRSGGRFPPVVEIYLAGAGALGLCISIIMAAAMGMPGEGDEAVSLGGPGFVCTVLALPMNLVAVGFAATAKSHLKKEEVERLEALGEDRQGETPAIVTTSTRALPPPAISFSKEPPSMAALAWAEPEPEAMGIDDGPEGLVFEPEPGELEALESAAASFSQPQLAWDPGGRKEPV